MSVLPTAFRPFLCLALVALAAIARADDPAPPAFAYGPVFSPNAAIVDRVESSLAADFVVLRGGLEQGMRVGVVCRVDRGPADIAEIIIVESRSDRSAALILGLSDGAAIQPGDVARLKTRPS